MAEGSSHNLGSKSYLGRAVEKAVLRYYRWRDGDLVAGYPELVAALKKETNRSDQVMEELDWDRKKLEHMAASTILGVVHRPALEALALVQKAGTEIGCQNLMYAIATGDGHAARWYYNRVVPFLPADKAGEAQLARMTRMLQFSDTTPECN